MTIDKNGIIALTEEGEHKMTELLCPKCSKTGNASLIRIDSYGEIIVRGIIQCEKCQHEFPFTMFKNCIQKLDTSLPGEQSHLLNPQVPLGIKDDVREAERASFAQCYNASVAMCRRALQLSLVDKGIKDNPLSAMLDEAKVHSVLKDDNHIAQAKLIKHFGDIGVHKREDLDSLDVSMAIRVTVQLLNDIFR
jgi:hypothetical protein